MAQPKMIYRAYGSTAPAALPAPRHAPDLEVIKGHDLDRMASRGASAMEVRRFKAILLAIVVIFSVASVRVAMTSACASTLYTNMQLQKEVSQASNDARQLEVEKAILTSSSRICDIASQTYGMVYVQPGANDCITLSQD